MIDETPKNSSGGVVFLDAEAEKMLNESIGRHPAGKGIREAVYADPVNRPRHYTRYKGLEIIDLTEQMNFNRGNVVKYVSRAGFKDREKEIQDLEKASWYLNREIERLKKG